MHRNTEIKYFSPTQNLQFLLSSLPLLWIWMFACAKIDRHNDRGLLTIFGICAITALLLTVFFSDKKPRTFFKTLLMLLFSCLLIFLLTLTVGTYTNTILSTEGLALAIPFVGTSILVYYNFRRLMAFPSNPKAFLVQLSLPILTKLILDILPFYDDVFAYDYGIGFSITLYLSLVFIAVSILCAAKRHFQE